MYDEEITATNVLAGIGLGCIIILCVVGLFHILTHV